MRPGHAPTLYNDTTHDRNINGYIYDQTSEGLISKVNSRVTPILSEVSERDLKGKKTTIRRIVLITISPVYVLSL